MVTCYRDRPRLYRRIDEARTVGLAACQREEQVARLDGAAVDRKALHIDSFRLRSDRSVIAEEVAKFHRVPVRPAQLGARDDYALLGCPRCRKNKAVGR